MKDREADKLRRLRSNLEPSRDQKDREYRALFWQSQWDLLNPHTEPRKTKEAVQRALHHALAKAKG